MDARGGKSLLYHLVHRIVSCRCGNWSLKTFHWLLTILRIEFSSLVIGPPASPSLPFFSLHWSPQVFKPARLWPPGVCRAAPSPRERSPFVTSCLFSAERVSLFMLQWFSTKGDFLTPGRHLWLSRLGKRVNLVGWVQGCCETPSEHRYPLLWITLLCKELPCPKGQECWGWTAITISNALFTSLSFSTQNSLGVWIIPTICLEPAWLMAKRRCSMKICKWMNEQWTHWEVVSL